VNNPTSFDYFQLEREYADALKRWQKDIELKIILNAKLEVAKEALEFYADEKTYLMRWSEEDEIYESIPLEDSDPITDDEGTIAREALEKIS